MFGTTKEVKKEAADVKYTFTVKAVRQTKNDKIVMIDLDINGVTVKGCMLKEITVKQDGEKHKAGDICYVYVVEDDGYRRYKEVEIGLEGDERIEIISGLEAGDMVAVNF